MENWALHVVYIIGTKSVYENIKQPTVYVEMFI